MTTYQLSSFLWNGDSTWSDTNRQPIAESLHSNPKGKRSQRIFHRNRASTPSDSEKRRKLGRGYRIVSTPSSDKAPRPILHVRSIAADHGTAYPSLSDEIKHLCRPDDKGILEPRIAYHHPILDHKFHISPDDDSVVMTDDYIERVIRNYVRAAGIAQRAGFHFVDVKHCHGYLGHEFLSAFTRKGKYGGDFEGRTRFCREIIQGIQVECPGLLIGVRLSAFDHPPFRPDPMRSSNGKPGPGNPEPFAEHLPYLYGFGCDLNNPLEPDLREPIDFIHRLNQLDVKLINVSCCSPYYNPHFQRPAIFPPSDGYQPPEDPLFGVHRQIEIVRQLKAACPDICDHYLNECAACDGIVYWNDGAPGLARLGEWRSRPADPFNDHEPVDASASAIAAQGLLRLGRYLGGERGKRYWQAGLTITRTLLGDTYLATSERHEGSLLHSIYHRPNGWDYIPPGHKVPCGESSMWGDYHLLELGVFLERIIQRKLYLTFFDA